MHARRENKMIYIMYFSPTGSTKLISQTVGESVNEILSVSGNPEPKMIDVLSPEARAKKYIFNPDDVLIVGCPTYAGRVPNKIMPFFKDNVKGNGSKCIAIVTFGGRSYDESLKELYHLMRDNSFKVAGGGAFVCRHSMSGNLAFGRPDKNDLKDACEFGKYAGKMILKNIDEPFTVFEGEVGPYYTPLKEDMTKADFLKARPKVNPKKCTSCRQCLRLCPMGSITFANTENAIPDFTGICIKCHACIRSCKTGALYFDDPDLLSHIKMLEKNYMNTHRDNELFV